MGSCASNKKNIILPTIVVLNSEINKKEEKCSSSDSQSLNSLKNTITPILRKNQFKTDSVATKLY